MVFDFDHNKSATSTESKPNYTYSAYGTYRVALVATKDSTCYDTSFATITIRDISSIKPNFIAESGDCINGKLNLRLIDLVPASFRVLSMSGRFNQTVIQSKHQKETLSLRSTTALKLPLPLTCPMKDPIVNQP